MHSCQKFIEQTRERIFPFTRSLSVLLVFVLLISQNSCNNTSIVSTRPTATNTIAPMTNTPMPTETTLPSQTLSPTPMIKGVWSDEPSMLIPRSAHAVVSSDSAIYALAGTDDRGKPVLEVEAFDGKQWKRETTLPGGG
jgi:hypothetical protein